MPSKNIFKITDLDGKKYSSYSKDFNKIHLDNKVGYNSIYGEKICHGCFVFEKTIKSLFPNFLKIKKIKLIEINFLKHFVYNKNIILKKNKKKISLIQEDKIKAELIFSCQNKFQFNEIKLKSYTLKKTKKFKLNSINYKILFELIRNISHYVGMVNPGKNSIIESIKINFFKNNLKSGFYSKLQKKGYPFIHNYLINKHFIIEFNSIIRPSLISKKINPTKSLILSAKKLTSNILILGASNGLGHDLLNILKHNKKITIFATYFQNQLKIKNKNVNVAKIDILNDKNKVIKLKKKKKISTIYYFPTSKISLNSNKIQNDLYQKIYLEKPIEILEKISVNSKINFFYPSTIFIENFNQKSKYARIKLIAENRLKKLAKKNNQLNISFPRLPQMNSKQNLNLLNIKFPNLIEILNNDKIIRKSFFLK